MSADVKTTVDQRRAWQTPSVRFAGKVDEVVKGGTGKVSVITGDPGESQKVPAMDM